jgi:hypothetical protein
VKEKMLAKFDPKDPRRVNARTAVGGARGSSNPADAFLMGTELDELGPRWPWRTASVKGNAVGVRVMTGPDGTACAALEPRRFGGDVYKVRVRVDTADAPAAKGDEASDKYDKGYGEADKPAATGLLTIWRALRIERYLRKPSADDPSIDEEIGKTLDPPIKLKEVAKELKKAFLDVELGRELKEASEEISEDDYKKAHETAVKMLIDNYGPQSAKFIGAMLPYPGKTAHLVHVPDFVTLVKNSGQTIDPADPDFYDDITKIISDYLYVFMHQFTKDALPGVTIFQALVGDNVGYGDTFLGNFWRSSLLDASEAYATTGGVVKVPGNTRVKDVVAKFGSEVKKAGAKFRFVGHDAKYEPVPLASSEHEIGTAGMVTLADYFAWLQKSITTYLGLSNDKVGHVYFDKGQVLYHATTGTKKVPPTDSMFDIEVWDPDKKEWNNADALSLWSPRDEVPTRKRKNGKFGEVKTSTSGVATPFRGAFVFYGHEKYDTYKEAKPEKRKFTYSLESNTLHETSHLLFMKHQWTNERKKKSKWWNTPKDEDPSQFPLDHDYDDTCVMSYHECDGDLCGRCLLYLRGWDINQISPNRPSAETLKNFDSYLA